MQELEEKMETNTTFERDVEKLKKKKKYCLACIVGAVIVGIVVGITFLIIRLTHKVRFDKDDPRAGICDDACKYFDSKLLLLAESYNESTRDPIALI